jgi:hypothetical protein
MHITLDALGRWNTELHYKDNDKTSVKIIGRADNLRSVFSGTDKWIQENRAASLVLIDSSAQWRTDGPTDPQKKMLKRLGIPLTADMTKGMASQIISKYYENNPKPKWLQNKIESKKRW